MQVPDFDADGLLPPGTYSVTFAELRGSVLLTGGGSAGASPTWDSAWRARLVDNAEMLVNELWQVGITEIFLDGTFVEAKDHPNDIDGYFEVDARQWATREPERNLNLLNPYKIWTWDPRSRRRDRNSLKMQLPMWHAYRVELYPHYNQLCGITDAHGHQLQFPSAFRQQRDTYRPKGIIRLLR